MNIRCPYAALRCQGTGAYEGTGFLHGRTVSVFRCRKCLKCFSIELPTRYQEPAIYDARVAAYEAQGMTRSDAQSVVDCEIAKEQRQ